MHTGEGYRKFHLAASFIMTSQKQSYLIESADVDKFPKPGFKSLKMSINTYPCGDIDDKL